MTMFTPVHTQVDTSLGVQVDAGIAALLEALWAAGLQTEFSCQGSGRGYICFTSAEAAEVFVSRSVSTEFTIMGRFVDLPTDSIDYLTELWSRT